MTIRDTVRTATLSALMFAVAMSTAAVLSGMETLPPIVPALAASLVLAGVEWTARIESPHAVVEVTPDILASWLVALIVACILLSGLGYLMPRGSQFTCEPLVPWRISIAIFGAFFSAWVLAGMSVRTADRSRQPLLRMMLFWIAPFYGFFHAPWFLAQSLAIPCEDRSLAQAVIVTAAMFMASVGGGRTGNWMFPRKM